MKIINKQKDAIPSRMNLAEFGNAMSQLNLSGVPEHKHPQAIMDHLMRIMADSITDREKSQEIHISRLLKQRQGQ
jgi:hypothetical protein